MNEIAIMSERVLARERESVGTDTGIGEDDPLVMILCERSVDSRERGLADVVATDQVTEVEESTEGAQHLRRDMTFNSRKINLAARCFSQGSQNIRQR